MPTEMGATETVIVVGDALNHTGVTGGVVVFAINGIIMKDTTKKNIYYINFLWLKIGISVEE